MVGAWLGVVADLWGFVMPTRSDPWPAGSPCWVDLAVPDVAAAAAFYGAVVGWEFVDTGQEFGHYVICRVNGHAAAAIGPRREQNRPAAWTVYLASFNVDATAAAITGNGGALLAAPFDRPGQGRVTVAVDPTGALFGVWQAAGGIGAEVYAEPGALVWTDAHLPDPDRGRAFYARVFGYEYQPVPGAPGDYTTFSRGGDRLGGMGGMLGAPAGTAPWWLAYFAVADTAAAVAAARTAGGTLLRGPDDTPFGFGRMALLTDPDGASFAVVGSAGTG